MVCRTSSNKNGNKQEMQPRLKVLCLVELQTSNHHKVCHGQIRNKRTFFNQLVVYISGLKVKKWHEARKAHYQRDRLDMHLQIKPNQQSDFKFKGKVAGFQMPYKLILHSQ